MKNLRKWTFVVIAVCVFCLPAIAQKGSSKKKSPQSTKATTTMEQIVAPFALPAGTRDTEPGWNSANDAAGVRWDGRSPQDRGGVFVRFGKTNLLGGITAGVSFLGSKANVTTIVLEKDGKPVALNQYSNVLRAQFAPKTSIRLLGTCSDDDSALYEISLEAKKPIYVHVTQDVLDMTPAFTSFNFYQRIPESWVCLSAITKPSGDGLIAIQQPKKTSNLATKGPVTLEQIVAPFALPTGSGNTEPGWNSADESVGVRWTDRAPRMNGKDVTNFIRVGTTNLLGLGTAEVIFDGTPRAVSRIEISITDLAGKIRKLNQYPTVLRAQFGPTTSIRLISKCGEDGNDQLPSFSAVYEVILESRKAIYVLLSTEVYGVPTSLHTSFAFSQRNEDDWKCIP